MTPFTLIGLILIGCFETEKEAIVKIFKKIKGMIKWHSIH
jgi:hypothetical protein